MRELTANDGGPLSIETLDALESLGRILLDIDRRLEKEGYVMIDGEYVKCEEYDEKEHTQRPDTKRGSKRRIS